MAEDKKNSPPASGGKKPYTKPGVVSETDLRNAGAGVRQIARTGRHLQRRTAALLT